MNVLYLLFSLINLILCVCASTDHVPVLLWTKNSLPSPPSLSVLDSLTFDKILHESLDSRQPMVVVFLEEDLSNEDFTFSSQDGMSIFQDLEKATKNSNVLYLPSVAHPMKAIRLLEADGYDRVRYEGEVPLGLRNPSVIMVPLDEGSSQERSQVLQSHMQLIQDVYDQLVNQYPDVLAVYSGRRSSWADSKQMLKRNRRDEPSGEEKSKPFLMRSENFVVIAKNITFSDAAGAAPVEVTGVASVSLSNGTENEAVTLEANLLPSGKLTFTVAGSSQRQWSLTELKINGKQVFPRDVIWAPSGWSYTCTNKLVFAPLTNDYNVTFIGLQIQPNVEDEKFGQAMDCVPYFSSPIWTGIVISFLLLSILSWGLMMLMDINTNDRFDDPKGKTITISATD